MKKREQAANLPIASTTKVASRVTTHHKTNRNAERGNQYTWTYEHNQQTRVNSHALISHAHYQVSSNGQPTGKVDTE